MAFKATVLANSIARETGAKMITFELEYPRFIHSEFMTHREFGRCASSSRAIPVMKMIKRVWNDPAMPVHWGANQAGMQANESLEGWRLKVAKGIWRAASKVACVLAYGMVKVGLHKQVANRILEPWQWISVVATTSNTTNIYGLRRHKDAQPEFKMLADLMYQAEIRSLPKPLEPGEWHLPYIQSADWLYAERECQKGRITRDMPKKSEVYEVLKKVSAARCARVSYLNHDQSNPSIEADLKLFDRLVGSVPLHASPTEHQGMPDSIIGEEEQEDRSTKPIWEEPELHGNLKGFVQHRKLLPNEYIS
uniref:Thymidilate synthase n=1 Tax=Pseudomonas phage Arace01 TaxID=3138526 RepID=A0AAU6VZG8_9VIRU